MTYSQGQKSENVQNFQECYIAIFVGYSGRMMKYGLKCDYVKILLDILSHSRMEFPIFFMYLSRVYGRKYCRIATDLSH